MQVSLEGSLALFMLQQDFQHILFCFLFLIEWNKNFSTVAAHEMHMNTRKHFSGNQSLIRWPGSGITMSIITHVNSSLLPLETEGGKYIVKIYNSLQTLGNKFQQGLFESQHKKRIRLTRKHVSGSQSVRKLTMTQIIMIITQNDISKKRDWSSREHKWQSYWALNWALLSIEHVNNP